MRDEPEIVKILRLQENLGVFEGKTHIDKPAVFFDEDSKIDEIEIEEINNNKSSPIGSNNTFGSSSQGNDDIVIYLDGSAKIAKINRAGLILLDLSGTDVVGKIFWELPGVFSKNPSDFRNLFDNALRREENQKLFCDIVDKSGKKIFVKFSMYPIKDGDSIKYIFVIGQDVTSEKITQNLLHETEQKLHNLSNYFETVTETTITFGARDLFCNVSDIIFQITPAGRITYVNSATEKIMGYKPEELIGDNFAKLIPNKIWEKEWKKSISEAKNLPVNKELNGFETYITDKNGRTIPVEVNGKLIRRGLEVVGKEHPVCIQGSIRDITERIEAREKLRKNAEQFKSMNEELTAINQQLTATNEELKAMQEELTTLNEELEQKVTERTAEVEKLLKHKDEFIAQLGHDLKSPLTPLVGLLPILETQINDSKSKELLEIIKRNVKYMRDLVVKTLQLERLNSPNMMLDIKDINLLEAVDLVIHNKQNIYENSNITIENDIGRKMFVKADSLQLGELFDNILTNAVKFTPKGGKITIDAKENEDFITVSVEDTGIGLTKEQIERIFDEFYKVDPARHDLESSGLGLSICKRIVEKHGGKIWVESPGLEKGSTFYFTFPAIYKRWIIQR